MRVHRLIGTALATLGVAGGGLAFVVAPALAELTHSYLPQSTIKGPNPPSEVFGKLAGVAVEPNGDFWVADLTHVEVYKFSSNHVYTGIKLTLAGNPPSFQSVSGGIVARPGGGVFVIDNTSKVIDMFSASGVYEGQFGGTATPQHEFKSVFGIGVAANGTLWIGNNTTSLVKVVDKFSSTGTYENFQLTEAGSPLKALGTIRSVAVRANGGILVGDLTNKLVDEFSAGGAAYEAQLPVPGGGGPMVLAVAVPSKRIAVGASVNNVVDEFSDAGILEGHTAVPAVNGTASEVTSTGVAYGPNESLIVADKKNNVVDFFGPPIETLTATTGGATPQVTTVTVLGAVNPEGVDASGFFEYGPCTTPTTCSSSPYGQTAMALVEGTQNGDFGNGSQYVKVEATLEGLQPNKTYHYRLVGHNTYGDFPATNSAELKTLPSKPVIEGQQALFVTLTTAELAAVVNPENEATTMKFEYGPCADAQSCATSPYSSKTVSASVGEGFGGTTLYSEVEALTPATTYHYRVVAKNLTGTTESAEGTFATPAIPPTVTPPAGSAPQAVAVTPTGIGTSTATLNGQVSPDDAPTSYRIELALGGNAAGVYAIVALGEAGTGSEAVPVSFVATGLQPGTTYSYRLTAANAYGWATSAPVTFTTPGVPAAFTQPIALSLLVTPSVALPKEPAKVTPRRLTRAQKLARALKACAKQPKSKRAACRRAARKKYGPIKSKAKKK
jgi:hypothetical protein